jgi:dipeptidyl aminopeptidase/acylaminoacyl peptidase
VLRSPACLSLASLASLALAGCYQRYQAPDCEISRPTPAADAPAHAPGSGRGHGDHKSGEPFVEQAIARTDPHPISIRDLLALDRVGDIRVGPDGKRVVFTRRKTDLEQNRGRKDLWLVDLAGGQPLQLTRNPENEDAPRWHPDGRTIFFLQKHAGSVQIFKTTVDGGEPTQVTHFPVDVGSFTVSPDGKTLAFSAEVYPDCDRAEILACTAARLEEAHKKSSGSGQLYKRLFVRHWDTWKDGRKSHLLTWNLGDPAAPPVDLSHALDADVPSRPFGDADEWAFSPDSRTLVFSARIAGAGEPWSTNFDLYSVPVDGSAAPQNLTPDNPAWDTGPVFSPDGTTLAYRAMRRPGYEADRFHVMQRPWPEGQAAELAANWDRSAEELLFSADGSTLYVTAEDTGQTSLFALDRFFAMRRTQSDDQNPQRLVRDGAVHHIQRAGDRIVYLHNTMHRPDELHSVAVAGSEPTAHTAINAEKLARARTGEAEQFSFTGAKGDTVHAYVVKPVDFDPTKKYPLAFLIHGGPQGSFGNRWSFRWNPQTYAGAGYAVVMVDFHGSTGYGQAFTDAIQGDWGGKPLDDLKAGLAAALKNYPWIDGDRACALGASYGGFMVNWIAGQWQSPFKCLVNHDGVFDHRMMYYATEELWFSEWEHTGPYWQRVASHEKHNPVSHVEKWSLPMLVIHGGLDYRIPDTQGIATFTALQRRGIPSRMLHFPDENHWVLKPANSLVWHETVQDWLDTWLKSGA